MEYYYPVITIVKSMAFYPSLKYDFSLIIKPIPTILSTASIKKMALKMSFIKFII